MKNLFDFKDYREYLASRFSDHPERGVRIKLAAKLGVSPSFISRVMKGQVDLSPEHGAIVNEFLGHVEDEGRFFLLLLQRERAGTVLLRKHFETEIRKMLDAREVVSDHIQVREGVTERFKGEYYSHWTYAAVHVLAMVPRFRTKEALAEALQQPISAITRALEVLRRAGLVQETKGIWKPLENRIHLKKSEPFVYHHHVNWRNRAAENFLSDKSVHYSGPLALSRNDAEWLRQELLELTSRLEQRLKQSPEEVVLCFNFDWFPIAGF